MSIRKTRHSTLVNVTKSCFWHHTVEKGGDCFKLLSIIFAPAGSKIRSHAGQDESARRGTLLPTRAALIGQACTTEPLIHNHHKLLSKMSYYTHFSGINLLVHLLYCYPNIPPIQPQNFTWQKPTDFTKKNHPEKWNRKMGDTQNQTPG